MKKALWLALLSAGISCNAYSYQTLLEKSHNTTIDRIQTYNQSADADQAELADVGLRLDNTQDKICDGYWMSKSDIGFYSNMAVLIAAYHAQSSIEIYGDRNNTWGQTSNNYCHLEQVLSN